MIKRLTVFALGFVTPTYAVFFLFAVGVVMIYVSCTSHVCIHNVWMGGGIGVALVSSAIVNLIWSYVTQKKIYDLANEVKVINNVTLEILGIQSLTRRKQHIEIDFETETNYVKATITHFFHYREDSKSGQTCPITIFSDFKGSIPSNEKIRRHDFIPDFYFDYIRVNTKKILEWNALEHREELCYPKWGKLYFSGEFTFPQAWGEEIGFEFKIKNTYRLYDRLVWTFQECSDCPVTIDLSLKTSCIQLKRLVNGQGTEFYLRIDHPLVEKIIEEHNRKYPDQIDVKTGEIKVDTLNFSINKPVLPFQGFEILWDLTEGVPPPISSSVLNVQ